MGTLGCCKTKPKTIENVDLPAIQQETHAPPRSSAYEVDYIPPTHAHISISQQDAVMPLNGNPISPASAPHQNIQSKNNTSQGFFPKIQQINRQLGKSNAFRQSLVPVPQDSSPISVNLHDLKTL